MPELSNWSALSPCQHFPTGQPCHHTRTFQLVSPVAMPALSNWSALSPCQNFPTDQHAKLGKYSQQKPQNFNKTAACSHHCPLRHPALSLGHWYTEVYLQIFDPGPSNPTTFLGLCSPGDYRHSIESEMGVSTFNSTEKALTFTIYDCILRIRPKKVCYLTKVSHLDVQLN